MFREAGAHRQRDVQVAQVDVCCRSPSCRFALRGICYHSRCRRFALRDVSSIKNFAFAGGCFGFMRWTTKGVSRRQLRSNAGAKDIARLDVHVDDRLTVQARQALSKAPRDALDLLDILSGRPSTSHRVGGAVRVNGRVMSPRDMRRVSGYVPQTDVLPGKG